MAQDLAQDPAQDPAEERDGDLRRGRGHSRSAVALRGLGFLILVALMTVIIVVQQRASGAYTAEFSATGVPEAGHVVTGLMVADYLAAAFSGAFPAPLAFIADYALHFPRVVLGASPPLFYLAEGAWVALLTPATPAILLLPAVLAALLVTTAGWGASRQLGILPGVAVGAVLMVLPSLREATIVVGLDLPLALLALWACLAYGAYLKRGCRRAALLFGVLAAAAILVKATGLALLALPILAVIVTGRYGLMRTFAFWLPFLVVAVGAGPWTAGTAPLVLERLGAPLGSGALERSLAVAPGAAAAVGALPATLAVIGALFALAGAHRHRRHVLPALLAAFSIAFAGALCLVPVAPQPADLLPLCAPLVMLAAVGGMRLLELVTRSWATLAGLIVMLVLLLAALPNLLEPLRKPAIGMDGVAQTFLADGSAPKALLVLADPAGDGALVAAVAQRDHDRQSFVVPGRLALAVSGRGPSSGVPLETPDDVLPALQHLGAGYVALADGPAPPTALQLLVGQAITDAPERFRLLGRFPRADGRGETRLYAWVPPPTPAKP